MSATLALDTATRTGWALKTDSGELKAGVWLLNFGPGRPHSCRQFNLWEALEWVHTGNPLGLVLAEKPVVMPGRESAARVCFGLIALVEMWCEAREVEYREVQIGQVKKHATGRGNARKPEMVAAAKVRWPELRIADDNAADALWVLDYALGNPGPLFAARPAPQLGDVEF